MEYRAITNDNYISHHGVKGMRWGHRKDGGPQGYLGTFPKGNMKKAGAGGGVSKDYLDDNYFTNEGEIKSGGGMYDLDKYRETAERNLEDFREQKQKEFEYDSTKWINEFIEKSDKAIQDSYKAEAIASTATSMVYLMNTGRALLGSPGVVATIAYETLKTPLQNISKSVLKSSVSKLLNQIVNIAL